MPPKKRSATPGSRDAPPAKKPKPAKPLGSFPAFSDGDVAISVGDLALTLHSQTLRKSCDYFANFDSTSTKFPDRFVLKPASLLLGPDADHTLAFAVVSPADADADADADRNNGGDDARIKRARSANEAIFRLLYRQPLSCTKPADFRDVAALATCYGCVDAVKDTLVTAILKASLGTTLFRDGPCALLNAACNLRDESIFSEALLHAVGRGCGDELLPSTVADLVDKHTAGLEAKVQGCWQAAMRCCTTDSIPRALAAVLMRNYVDQHVACTLVSPLRPEVYGVLFALHTMENIKPLLQAGLLARVDDVDEALVAGQDFIVAQDVDRYGDDDDYYAHLYRVHRGFDECVNRRSIEGELRTMLQNVKQVIKPLFVGDRNASYFTCVQFAGPFPWPKAPSNSP